MRNEISVVLIVCGTLLALAPPASDYFANQRASQVLIARSDFQSVNFGLAPMSDVYRFGLWALGAAMIFVGIVGAWLNRWIPPDGGEGHGRPGTY